MIGAHPVGQSQLAGIKALTAERILFGWRYISKIGAPGAELSQPILYPMSSDIKSAAMGSGIVEWTQLKPQQNPMQWHIIKALAELPLIKMAPIIMVEGVAVLKFAQARVLE
jgi:hypothetical protein